MAAQTEDKAIYIIPAGKEFSLADDQAVCVVYAPLSNKAFLATREETENIRAHLCELIEQNKLTYQAEDPLTSLFAELRRESLMGFQIEPKDCTHLTILPNHRCNFHCSYCYSAKGRSKAELTVEPILALAEWAYRNASAKKQDCRILFLGGGEPLLSWDVVRESILGIERLAVSPDSRIILSISTNGSLLTEEKIDFFLRHHVNVQVSFEILEEVQNAQRGHYETVHHNILKALQAGLQVSLHSVVTSANVTRMEEAVRVASRHYGAVRKIGFEPVIDSDFISREAEAFYETFYQNFIAAESFARSKNIELVHSASRILEQIRPHYCAGQLILTPQGTFSACEAVSSPQEQHYSDFVFGGMSADNEVVIDRNAFRRFHPARPGFMREECASCWARWNCGGGCHYKRTQYSPEVFAQYCRFFRRLLLHCLADRLRREYAAHSGGKQLDELVLNTFA